MSDKYELSRVEPGSLKKQEAESSFDDGRMGRNFRRVFAAERCQHRKIYWIETALNGKVRLRQVLRLHREKKSEDRLIAMLPPGADEALIRLAIANANHGQWLTGIRWEVYADFACSQMLMYGRFDHFDLFPLELAEEEIKRIGTSVINIDFRPEAWDYDGLLLGHACPGCGKQGPVDLLIYYPSAVWCHQCYRRRRKLGIYKQSCDPQEKSMAQRLLQRFLRDCHVGVFPACCLAGGFDPEIMLIDFRATPLLCWIISEVLRGKPVLDCHDVIYSSRAEDDRIRTDITPKNIHLLFQHSVFPLIAKIEELQQVYKRFSERVLTRYEKKRKDRPRFDWTSDKLLDELFETWDEEGRVNAVRDYHVILNLQDWLFATRIKKAASKEELADYNGKTEQVRDMAMFYAVSIDEMLDVKARELEQKEERERCQD